MAAYLQSQFPAWVSESTPRHQVPIDTDRIKVWVPYDVKVKWEVDSLPYIIETAHYNIAVELVEYRIGIEGVSEIFDGKYHIGLGFGSTNPEYFGVVLWWTEKWIPKTAQELFEWLNTMIK